ncbi:hypothetical protein [Oceanobacillus jeddahense]|uniref:hypothetical protein n=1 Tax=Oceanobacillus jeddahense TaxID=1462527 RepID=UPI0005962C7D|nr:hypothetical protein [Oceanobacillus jeddahense]
MYFSSEEPFYIVLPLIGIATIIMILQGKETFIENKGFLTFLEKLLLMLFPASAMEGKSAILAHFYLFIR